MKSPNELTPEAISQSIITELITNRRSIKPSEFSDQRVPDQVISQMLSNANWAPTHGMTEPWRFFVFTDEARQRFGNRLAEIYEQVTPPDSFKSTKCEKLKSNAERSSHLIVIAMKRQESEKIPEIEEIEAVACAVQNLHLTATAFGVGGYWSSGKAICSDELRDELGLQRKDRVLGLFYVGYPSGPWPTGGRGLVDEKVVWKTS